MIGDGSTNTPVSALVYAVNNVGQRTSVTSIGSAFAAPTGWAWGYDALGQVTSATHATQAGFTRGYAYDDIGNRKQSSTGAPGSALTTAYTPNALNQYTAIQPPNPAPAIAPTHDFDGNQLTGYRAPATGAGMTFEWDGENRLKTVKDAGGNVVVSYRYDHGGRRVRKTLAAGSDTAFVYDGWNLVAEYNLASALLTRRHTWGMDLSGSMQGAGGVGGLLATESLDAANLGTWFPTYDGNGNVSEYLDGAGTLVAHFEYDPFGNTLVNTDAANRFTFRFSTKYCDQETGLYYYGYRYYDPVNGRWPSRDPIEEMGGVGLYGLTGNDGVNFWDILGLYFADGASRFGIKENGVQLNGKGDIDLDIKGSGGDTYTTIVTQHEQMHKDKIKKSVYWNALPFKQIFKVYARDAKTNEPLKNENGQVICYGWGYFKNKGTAQAGQYELVLFDDRKDSELWESQRGIWNHGTQEYGAGEVEAWTWEIKELRKHKGALKERADILEKSFLPAAVKMSKDPNVENPNWTKFANKIRELKVWHQNHNIKWEWKDPSRIYTDIK